jgi:hypothetical protein
MMNSAALSGNLVEVDFTTNYQEKNMFCLASAVRRPYLRALNENSAPTPATRTGRRQDMEIIRDKALSLPTPDRSMDPKEASAWLEEIKKLHKYSS